MTKTETETVIRYTTAEPAYDYGYTRHMGVVGFDKRERPVRKVHIEKGREAHQCGRYFSGNRFAIDHVEYAKQVESGFIRPVGKTIEVDTALVSGTLRGLGKMLEILTQERADIAEERANTKDDEYMLGALDGRDAALQSAAQTLILLHDLLTKAGV